MDFLKAEQLTSTKWRVLGIPYGGPIDGKDTDKEFFTPRTNIYPDWFDRRPLVWHHNLDRSMRDKSDPRKDAEPVIGTTDDLEEKKDGWWVTAWLHRQHQYFQEISSFLQRGKMFGSSGTMPNFVRTDSKTGEILVWPYVEQTFTPIPANLFSRTVPAKAAEHFKSAGLDFPDLDSLTADLRDDLSADGDPVPGDLSTGGEPEAIQRLPSDPRRERVKRLFVAAFPLDKVERLRTNR